MPSLLRLQPPVPSPVHPAVHHLAKPAGFCGVLSEREVRGSYPNYRSLPMAHVLGVFIPIIALSIPLAAVVGKQIIQPLINSRALPGAGDDRRVQMLEQRVASLEQSLESMETSVARIAEVAEFHNQLASPAPAATGMPSAGVAR